MYHIFGLDSLGTTIGGEVWIYWVGWGANESDEEQTTRLDDKETNSLNMYIYKLISLYLSSEDLI